MHAHITVSVKELPHGTAEVDGLGLSASSPIQYCGILGDERH